MSEIPGGGLHRNRRSLVVITTALCAMAGPCLSAEVSVPPELVACATVKRSAERLACYDQSMGRLLAGEVDSTHTAPAHESMFGAKTSLTPATQPEQAPMQREELSSLTARITALHSDAEGRNIFELDNGQTWRQTSGSTVLLLKVGDVVTISRAALGSFRLATPTGRTAKVSRTR